VTFTVGRTSVTISSDVMSFARDARVDLPGVARAAVSRIDAGLHARRPNAVDFVAGPGIPAIGVTGFTNAGTGAVTISVQSQSPVGVAATMTRWVPPTMAHEMFESKRILEGPGFGRTLGDWLVTDGGADNFAHSLYADVGVFPWDRALTPSQERAMWSRAQPELARTADDFGKWFFGADGIPHWAAYTIGYHLVGSYLARHARVSPADVATTPSAVVLHDSGYVPPS
jgi:hypothetical protein